RPGPRPRRWASVEDLRIHARRDPVERPAEPLAERPAAQSGEGLARRAPLGVDRVAPLLPTQHPVRGSSVAFGSLRETCAARFHVPPPFSTRAAGDGLSSRAGVALIGEGNSTAEI